jgi:hypothetical protein
VSAITVVHIVLFDTYFHPIVSPLWLLLPLWALSMGDYRAEDKSKNGRRGGEMTAEPLEQA